MSEQASKLSILGRCRLFCRVDAARREGLAALSTLHQVEKSTLLFRQGDHTRAMYVVGVGQARVFQLAPGGKEHTLHLCGPGHTFAEIAAIDGLPYPASAETITACTLLAIDAEGLAALLQQDAVLSRQLMLGMAMWVRHTIGLLEGVVLRDAVGRVAHYLHSQAPSGEGTVMLPAAHVHVAKHLNLTPETFSRSLRRLQDDGLIRVDGRTVAVLNWSALQAVADGI